MLRSEIHADSVELLRLEYQPARTCRAVPSPFSLDVGSVVKGAGVLWRAFWL